VPYPSFIFKNRLTLFQELASQVLTLLSKYCSLWKHHVYQDFEIIQVHAAMTNRVYVMKCHQARKHEPRAVLLRLYGKSNWMFCREREYLVAKILANNHLAPKWYCAFSNGRVEEFIESLPVTAESFRSPTTAEQISTHLAHIHSLLPLISREGAFDLNDNYIWEKVEKLRTAAVTAHSTLLAHYNEDTHPIPLPHEDDSEEDSISESTGENTDALYRRMLSDILQWGALHDSTLGSLKQETLSCPSPLIFGHCDLHHGNTLLLNPTSHLDLPSPPSTPIPSPETYFIIDFEYSMPVPRGFDLANYFCEFCADYESPTTPAHALDYSLFPSPEYRQKLLSHYSRSLLKQETSCNSTRLAFGSPTPPSALHSSLISPAVCEDSLAEDIDAEMLSYLPLVHLQWAYWGLSKAADHVDSPKSQISFDYLLYAHQRFEQWRRISSGCS
jgi:choline kinase